MTEENKPQKNRIFYWLGAFIIVGLLTLSGQYLYWKFISGNVREPVNHALADQDTKLSSAIKDYGQWSASLADKKMDVSHELTKTGLDKIANVLTLMSAENSVNQDNDAIHTDINRIHGLADSITYNWKSGKHADMIKLAFSKTTDVLTDLQTTNKPVFTKEVQTLKLEIKDIDASTLTLKQRDQVKDAFKQTAFVFENF
ncbi:MAG: hypothetical protein EOP45_05095 [Sphingobacteriaceae bacterium]|nr:MAG: hypothetical protein EOP45_05095 [Sphingobacteriaceae bacterium]